MVQIVGTLFVKVARQVVDGYNMACVCLVRFFVTSGSSIDSQKVCCYEMTIESLTVKWRDRLGSAVKIRNGDDVLTNTKERSVRKLQILSPISSAHT